MKYPLYRFALFLSIAKTMIAREAEIIIIGTGAAGLSAAIEAANMGANVLLLDKTTGGGGNSAKASSGINGADTIVQAEKGVFDSIDQLVEDTMKTGQQLGDPKLVRKLAADSKEAIRFLKEDIEIPLTDVIQLGGHSTPRTHRLSTQAPIGFSLIKALKTKLDTVPKVRTELSAEVVDLIFDDSSGQRAITGVVYTNAAGEVIRKKSDGVIIATGGMAFDHTEDGIFSEFAPGLRGLATSSGPQANGAGIVLGRRAGAELIHMDKIQIHPTGLVDPKDIGATSKILGPEALRGVGGILVKKNGKRFVDELARRGHITEVIRSESDDLPPLSSGREQKSAFIMLNAEAVEAFSAKMFGFYVGRGIFRKYDNAAEMCAAEGIPLDQLSKTFDLYSRYVEGVADEFGKTHFPVQFKVTDEIWVANITPVIHYTMGGMKINERAAVQRARADIGEDVFVEITGLYAAGECTGGVHGGDRLAGNSLLECVVFGRTAGKSAVEDASRKWGDIGPNEL